MHRYAKYDRRQTDTALEISSMPASPDKWMTTPVATLLRSTTAFVNPRITVTRDDDMPTSDEEDACPKHNRNEEGQGAQQQHQQETGRPIMDRKEYKERFAVAEALARASMLTSPAVRRRLAARKVEIDMMAGVGTVRGNEDEGYWTADFDYVPPRELLMYMVRMGSFSSAPKILNADTQDDTLPIPPYGLNHIDLVHHCRQMHGEDQPALLNRSFLHPTRVTSDVTDGLRLLQLNAVSKVCGPGAAASVADANRIRLFQWNILSQSLGQSNDNFVRCPDEALTWEHRKYLIVQEIVQHNPDVVCLQEVDHFKFLQSVLGTQDYAGIFFPKPDSPCLYISENNGPDGCAVFYKKSKYELLGHSERILEVWRVQSNQVAIAANLRVRETGREFSVCTTHLKARKGSLLSKLRNEQGKDLLRFASRMADKRPLLMCGDFNAEPIEPVYGTIVANEMTTLSSAYADMMAASYSERFKAPEAAAKTTTAPHEVTDANDATNKETTTSTAAAEKERSRSELLAAQEPPFTTWKIREDGEVCHTIDYVFYTPEQLRVQNCLMFPTASDIGSDRTPSLRYPSDHFSLVCDFELVNDMDKHAAR